MKTDPVRSLTAFVVAVLVTGIDQLSKQWALYALSRPSETLILPGPVDLTLVFNRSNAFGLAPVFGEFTRWGLTGLSILVVLILIWIVARRELSGLASIGLAFIMAGAAGNALDRILYGAVVDFINAAKVGFIWVFNLADVSLDIGIGLSLLSMLLVRLRRKPVARAEWQIPRQTSNPEVPMTPENQTLVRDSFAKVVPIAPQAAAMFYDRLFVLDPTLRPLFKGDMNEQGRKLMAMIGTAVANLDKLETIVPAVQDLGRRHATYGVPLQSYDTVGAALLWTLGQGLGDAFTPPVEAAWTEAYTILATVMKDAATA